MGILGSNTMMMLWAVHCLKQRLNQKGSSLLLAIITKLLLLDG